MITELRNMVYHMVAEDASPLLVRPGVFEVKGAAALIHTSRTIRAEFMNIFLKKIGFAGWSHHPCPIDFLEDTFFADIPHTSTEPLTIQRYTIEDNGVYDGIRWGPALLGYKLVDPDPKEG